MCLPGIFLNQEQSMATNLRTPRVFSSWSPRLQPEGGSVGRSSRLHSFPRGGASHLLSLKSQQFRLVGELAGQNSKPRSFQPGGAIRGPSLRFQQSPPEDAFLGPSLKSQMPRRQTRSIKGVGDRDRREHLRVG